MICPRCFAEFEPSPKACPECGVRLLRNISGVIKTSSVMIATGEEQSFYGSVQDVPEPLRTQLIESTQSENSGTIVIADRAGKAQLTQVVARRESAKNRKAQPNQASEQPGEPDSDWRTTYLEYKFFGQSWVVWAGILLFVAAAALIALVFNMRA